MSHCVPLQPELRNGMGMANLPSEKCMRDDTPCFLSPALEEISDSRSPRLKGYLRTWKSDLLHTFPCLRGSANPSPDQDIWLLTRAMLSISTWYGPRGKVGLCARTCTDCECLVIYSMCIMDKFVWGSCVAAKARIIEWFVSVFVFRISRTKANVLKGGIGHTY